MILKKFIEKLDTQKGEIKNDFTYLRSKRHS